MTGKMPQFPQTAAEQAGNKKECGVMTRWDSDDL
jgi:hypothetical protein